MGPTAFIPYCENALLPYDNTFLRKDKDKYRKIDERNVTTRKNRLCCLLTQNVYKQ